MAKRRKSRITDLAGELASVLRDATKHNSGIHPEIWAKWPSLVGSRVADKAVPKVIINRVLHVAVINSTWVQELSFLKERLLERLRETVGYGVVRDVRLSVDPTVVARHRRPQPKKVEPSGPDIPYNPALLNAIEFIDDEELKRAVARAIDKRMEKPQRN